MYMEIVGSILASLGGATIIIFTFAKFLGGVWASRIAEATKAKFESQMIELRAANERALSSFKADASKALEESNQFSQISQRFYQHFFNERVKTYLRLLEIKNNYISDMEEDFVAEEVEAWGRIFRATYDSLRDWIIKNQLYISNDLDNVFHEFRKEASRYIKEADLVEAYSKGDVQHAGWDNRAVEAVNEKFSSETAGHMARVMDQISQDVSKLRSRIEIDKA